MVVYRIEYSFPLLFRIHSLPLNYSTMSSSLRNLLRSVRSNSLRSSIKMTPTNIALLVGLAGLLMVRLPFDIHQTVTSIPARLVWVLGTVWLVQSHGIMAGVLSALIFIVVLTDVHIEGMTSKEQDADASSAQADSTNTKDPVHDALQKVKAHSASSLPPSSSSVKQTSHDNSTNEEDDANRESLESNVANNNQQGTMAQQDNDRAMKISSIVNSKDESVVHQMKKEREQEQQQQSQNGQNGQKEGFGVMEVGNAFGSAFSPF